MCGAISGYNAVEPQPGPRNMFMLVTKKLSLRGFIVSDHTDLHGEFIAKVTQLVTLRPARGPRDRARRAGGRRAGVPRPPARRQHREDDRAAGGDHD